MENLSIRQARDNDIEEIKGIVKAAFDRPGKNEYFNEWEFVDKVRNDSGFIPELCLIATVGKEIIGYILLSKAFIGKNGGLSLGPLAVKPSYQRKGIGKRLINYGMKKAKEKRFEWIVLTGGDYYTQFGFESASKYGVVLSDNHLENPYLKIKFLNSNREVFGKMRFCDSFYDGNGELL
ncbi:MAG: N-acetyltransferase [Firmicutes bacterium]|nr:N-acetyltransferase [Bacillota bacterium]